MFTVWQDMLRSAARFAETYIVQTPTIDGKWTEANAKHYEFASYRDAYRYASTFDVSRVVEFRSGRVVATLSPRVNTQGRPV